MEEIEALNAKLAECKRHADNHRRSRDYHKEASADLRVEVEELKNVVEFWQDQHRRMDDAYCQSRRHHETWMTIAIVLGIFSIGMSVLFFWSVRS